MTESATSAGIGTADKLTVFTNLFIWRGCWGGSSGGRESENVQSLSSGSGKAKGVHVRISVPRSFGGSSGKTADPGIRGSGLLRAAIFLFVKII
mgnify:CR=1 FL=1